MKDKYGWQDLIGKDVVIERGPILGIYNVLDYEDEGVELPTVHLRRRILNGTEPSEWKGWCHVISDHIVILPGEDGQGTRIGIIGGEKTKPKRPPGHVTGIDELKDATENMVEITNTPRQSVYFSISLLSDVTRQQTKIIDKLCDLIGREERTEW